MRHMRDWRGVKQLGAIGFSCKGERWKTFWEQEGLLVYFLIWQKIKKIQSLER